MGMTRRGFLVNAGTTSLVLPWARLAWAQKKTSVTIAFPEAITSMDPQPGSRNVPRESFYQAVFDRYLGQDRQLKFQGGIVEAWQYTNPEKTAMDMKVRQGISFHDGSALTAEDVAFSLNRMRTTAPYSVVYKNITSIEMPDRFSLRLKFGAYDPAFTKWLGFLAGFVLPKAAFEKAGAEEFAKNPVGSGPYKVVRFVPGSLLVLEAFDKYWKGAPPIKRAIFKVVGDPTARLSEILSGDSDITLEVPVEEFNRLAAQPGLKGVKQPVTDVAALFVSPRFEPFQKEEARLAVHHAIDKKTLVDKVLLGFGIPLSTTEAPLYEAYTDFSFPYNPDRARDLLGKAGYSKSNPLRLKTMTTKGAKTKDFEVMTAITQMWKDVGIEAELEIITIPQFFQHRSAKTIAPLALYFWSNSTGDPINSVGHMTRNKGPFKVWESPDVDPKVDPIFMETDERKRIGAAKEAARYVIERGYIIPLYQVVMPVIMKKDLVYEPYSQGFVLPQDMSWT